MSRAWTIAVAAALMAAAVPAAGGEFNPLGDGSDFNNADLLRDTTTGCENCVQAPPYEWDEPPFDLDWKLGLRGAITESDTGTKVEFLALPEARLTHQNLRGGFSVGAAAELSHELDGNTHVDSLTLDGSYDYRLDAVTTAGLKGSLSLSQDDPDEPGYASNVAEAPLVVEGKVEVTGSRDLGLVAVTLRGSAGRTVYGETTYDDASTASNDYQNVTMAGLGGRLGVKLTPGVTAFVDAAAEYEAYDEASPSLAAKLDNVTYAARSGLNLKVLSTLELEGSLGLAYRDFADETLPDFTAMLYDAKAIFRPDETLTLTGALTTSIASPGTTAGAMAKVTYAATGEAAYQVNPWLRLRSSVGWSEAHYEGVSIEEQKWNAGVGADYLLNEHMDATADYTFSRSTTTPDPSKDEQRVMLGLNIHR